MGKNRRKGSATGPTQPASLAEQPLPNFQSDFQTYCAFKQTCRGWLVDAALDEIWHSAKDLTGPDSYQEKYQLALAFVQDRMANVAETPLDKPNPPAPLPPPREKKERHRPTPSEPPQRESSTPFDQFVASYADVVEMEKLLEIWQGLDSCLPDADKAEIASLYALDHLQSQCARAVARHKPLRPRKQVRHQSKMPTSMTDQELALYLLGVIFEGEALTERDRQLALMDHSWNLDAATKFLCDKLLKNGCFIRPGVSFADVASASPSAPASSVWSLRSVDSAASPSTPSQTFPFQATVVHSSGRISSLPPPPPPVYMQSEGSSIDSHPPAHLQSPEYQLAMRSLCIFRQKNPCIRLSLNSHFELRFDGTDASFLKQQENDLYVLGLSIDLHGLLVARSLQIVDSCLDYYYTRGERLCASSLRKQLLLSFIVGKGLHSLGGQARLGPAVCKFLRERGEEKVLLHDGVVAVHIAL